MPIEELKEKVCPVAKKHGVIKVYLFGSRARGDNDKDSDYDFLISKGKVNSLIKYVALVSDLEEILGTHVDLITDTSSDIDFLDNIRGDLVLIYDKQGQDDIE